MGMKKYSSMPEYLADQTGDVQQILTKTQAVIEKAEPNAELTFSYGVPTYSLNGKPLVYFNAYKAHMGIYPDPEDRDSGITLKQALTMKARLEHVKYVEEGEAVTYSARFVAPRRMRIGTLHAGYSDGVPRGLTRKGLVRFKGATRRILGTVSVNHCVIDVDGMQADVGDVVELVSPEGVNTLEKVSSLAGIMTYSFCIALNPLTPRVYMKDGIPVALSELKLI